MKYLRSMLFGFLCAVSLAAKANPAIQSTAASLAFTSKDPIVLQANKLVADGQFHEAQILLSAHTNGTDSDAVNARLQTLDMLHRIRFEYSLTPKALLARLKTSIPDATEADLDRWAAETRARYRMIDGQKFYFRYEPQNIFIFSADAQKRREQAGNSPSGKRWDLVGHLKDIVEEADRTGRVEVQPVRHQVRDTLTIQGDIPGVKAGSVVRVWMPFPQEYRQQQDVRLVSASPAQKLIAPSAIDGNPVTGGAQRTVYFEERVEDPSKPMKFKLAFDYVSYAYYPKLDEAKVESLPSDWNEASLGERPPHIVFTPEMRAQTASIIGSETNALAKARKIFRWVSASIPWNAEDEYCTIPSFAIKGFTSRRGDCGIQNTVFITLCRIAGIPARWQSGYETRPGNVWGMHDWSEIYIAPWGWLPCDASYGVKKSDDPRIADFYCGHQDSYRMIINLDWGRELYPPKKSPRSDPSDFQRGEVEIDGKNIYYDQWSYKMEIVREPASTVAVLKN
jgi:hypothetical protein